MIIKYILLTIKHKYFVLIAGLKVKANIYDLIVHDLSKFSKYELRQNARQFFGDKSDRYGFICSWLHHQNNNKHHWEYWIPRTGSSRQTPPYPDNQPILMPERYVREMVADWLAATRTYEEKWPDIDNWSWYIHNKPKQIMHETTRELVEKILNDFKHR